MWHRRKVQSGEKIGRKLGFPTLNFSVGRFTQFYKFGVYASEVLIGGEIYHGALFFGPKSSHGKPVLEVHVLNFKGDLYDQFISFKIGKKIREPMVFASPDELRKQIERDVQSVISKIP